MKIVALIFKMRLETPGRVHDVCLYLYEIKNDGVTLHENCNKIGYVNLVF